MVSCSRSTAAGSLCETGFIVMTGTPACARTRAWACSSEVNAATKQRSTQLRQWTQLMARSMSILGGGERSASGQHDEPPLAG
jgi:hypothetical protein